MSRSSVKAKKPNRYERIKARADGLRPYTFAELSDWLMKSAGQTFVLRCKVLTQAGGYLDIKWSEREADAEAKRRKRT